MKKHYAAALIAIIFWGSSYFVTAVAYQTIAPLQLALVRSALSAVLFFIYLAVTKVHERPLRRDLPHFALAGLFGVTLYFTFQNIGLSLTSSSNAALLVAAFPAIVLAVECVWERTLPSLRQIVGIAVAVGGVALLTGSRSGSGRNDLLGSVLLLVAGVMWGCYNLVSKKISSRYSVATLTAWQMVFGSIFLIPCVLVEGAQWVAPTLATACSILYLSVFCSLLSFLAYNYALTGASVTGVASLINLQPVVGIVCSYFVLHETVTLQQVLGGAVVVAGVLLTNAHEKRG